MGSCIGYPPRASKAGSALSHSGVRLALLTSKYGQQAVHGTQNLNEREATAPKPLSHTPPSTTRPSSQTAAINSFPAPGGSEERTCIAASSQLHTATTSEPNTSASPENTRCRQADSPPPAPKSRYPKSEPQNHTPTLLHPRYQSLALRTIFFRHLSSNIRKQYHNPGNLSHHLPTHIHAVATSVLGLIKFAFTNTLPDHLTLALQQLSHSFSASSCDGAAGHREASELLSGPSEFVVFEKQILSGAVYDV